MKTFYSLFAVLFLTCIAVSCKQNPGESDSTEVKSDASDQPTETATFDPISQDTFNSWEARWNANFRSYFATDSLSFFDMPLVDLSAILDESSVDNARFYMGMDTSFTPHLMLVGTYRGVPDFSVIADYSNACPPRCPE